MSKPSDYLEALSNELARLPGIGRKSASRLAFHILKQPIEEVQRLAGSLVAVKENVQRCNRCGGISDNEICSICSNHSRDNTLICVVEEARDVLIIDGTGEFKGLFHVLGGLIAPLDGVGPEDLNISPLVQRCQNDSVREVILALNPTIEGDATALYLARLLQPQGILVTRIAHGLPVGGDIEFADSATIIRSLEGRRKL